MRARSHCTENTTDVSIVLHERVSRESWHTYTWHRLVVRRSDNDDKQDRARNILARWSRHKGDPEAAPARLHTNTAYSLSAGRRPRLLLIHDFIRSSANNADSLVSPRSPVVAAVYGRYCVAGRSTHANKSDCRRTIQSPVSPVAVRTKLLLIPSLSQHPWVTSFITVSCHVCVCVCVCVCDCVCVFGMSISFHSNVILQRQRHSFVTITTSRVSPSCINIPSTTGLQCDMGTAMQKKAWK